VQYFFLYPLVRRLVGLGPKFLKSGSQLSLNGFGVGSGLKTDLQKIFYPPLKNLVGEKTPNFAEHQPTRRQLEACNFKTAQHIDKQKPDASSTINALKQYQTWEHHPMGF